MQNTNGLGFINLILKEAFSRVSYEINFRVLPNERSLISSNKGLSDSEVHRIAGIQQQQIFEPFERLGAEITATEGTGIGLTISKQLVELMSSEIGIENSVGNGCCFFLEFKLIENTIGI